MWDLSNHPQSEQLTPPATPSAAISHEWLDQLVAVAVLNEKRSEEPVFWDDENRMQKQNWYVPFPLRRYAAVSRRAKDPVGLMTVYNNSDDLVLILRVALRALSYTQNVRVFFTRNSLVHLVRALQVLPPRDRLSTMLWEEVPAKSAEEATVYRLANLLREAMDRQVQFVIEDQALRAAGVRAGALSFLENLEIVVDHHDYQALYASSKAAALL